MLNSDRPPAELGQFTGFLMNYLGTRSGRRFAAALEPFGLHPRHFGVMTVLDARPGTTQQDLADHSRVDRSSMVAVLDELESRGLAERRPDPADRRKRSIHLTEDLGPITTAEKLGAGLLMFATLAIGLYPKLLLDRILPAVEAMRFLK